MNDPFLNNLPYIDVHRLDREYTIMLLKNLILESILLKNYKIYIIHGKGSGILKKEIHNYLKTNKYVEKYYIYNFNDGITMIELKNN